METISMPNEIRADAEAIIQAAMVGRPVDPEIANRIHEQAKKITEEVFQKHGVLDVGVPAIRELRGEFGE